jgi:CRP-like cAMP-binding protein
MAIDDDIALLRRLDFFQAFQPDQLRLILFAADSRVLRPNEVLFSKGDATDGGYLLQSGLISLNGEAHIPTEFVRPGMLIGEYSLLVEGERTTTAMAREPSRIIILPRKSILRLLNEYPDVALALQHKLAKRADAFAKALDRVVAHIGV